MAYFGIFDATSRDYQNKHFGSEILPEEKDAINKVIEDAKNRFQMELATLNQTYADTLSQCKTPEAIYKQIRDWSQAEGAGGCLTSEQQYLLHYMLQLYNVKRYLGSSHTFTERLLDSLIYVHCVDALFTSHLRSATVYSFVRCSPLIH